MLGYVPIGTRDLPRAVALYDTIAKEMETVGNGIRVAMRAKDAEQVKRVYDLELSMGGADERHDGDG